MQAGSVDVVEVGPRDGLQSDPTVLAVDRRVEMIRRLHAAGLQRIEVVSFVHPDRVPQMAGAEQVLAGIADLPDLRRIGLVLNRKGLDRALAAGVDEINAVVVVSETFAQRNQGQSTAALVETWGEVAAAARAAGVFSTLTLSAVFGCPFEGPVARDRFATVLAAALVAGVPDELALADTVGAAVPTDVTEVLGMAAAQCVDSAAGVRLRAHFHNTRNTGYANAVAALGAGVTALDASFGGIGGCPFAPRATGNIATEDLVNLLSGMGVETGVDLDRLIALTPWMEATLGHDLPGLVSRAGRFVGAAAS
jgi:hydroxymethylglutaryl-CoA lyase